MGVPERSLVGAPGLVKTRAESGRHVERVGIGAFIDNLPGARSTQALTSDSASGSTRQAASIVEAVEAGASGGAREGGTRQSRMARGASAAAPPDGARAACAAPAID